jgi:hypothetical protein
MEHLHDFIQFLKETDRTEDVKHNKLAIDLKEQGDRTIFILKAI